MNEHASSNIKGTNSTRNQNFIEGVPDHLHQSHNEELFGANFTDNSTKRDKNCCNTVGSSRDDELLKINVVLSVRITLHDALPERVEQNVYLNDDGIDEESVGGRKEHGS